MCPKRLVFSVGVKSCDLHVVPLEPNGRFFIVVIAFTLSKKVVLLIFGDYLAEHSLYVS